MSGPTGLLCAVNSGHSTSVQPLLYISHSTPHDVSWKQKGAYVGLEPSEVSKMPAIHGPTEVLCAVNDVHSTSSVVSAVE